MTQSLIKKITQDKYAKNIIQALMSQAQIGIKELEADKANIFRYYKFNDLISLLVEQWERIKLTFDFKFPDNFIESAMFLYCGDKINPTFEYLNLLIDDNIVKELRILFYGK